MYRSEEAKQEQLKWTSDDEDDLDEEESELRSDFVIRAVVASLLATGYLLIVPKTSELDRAYFLTCIGSCAFGRHLNRMCDYFALRLRKRATNSFR